MTVYVDEPRRYLATQVQPAARRHGLDWCHLTTDGDLDDLHRVAAAIGLKREWFQVCWMHAHSRTGGVCLCHYDLIASKRPAALAAGAVAMSAREQARRRHQQIRTSVAQEATA